MASEKAIKKTSDMKETHEEPRVAALTNQFEALAEKANKGFSDMDVSQEAEAHAHAKAREPHIEKSQHKDSTKTTAGLRQGEAHAQTQHERKTGQQHTSVDVGNKEETRKGAQHSETAAKQQKNIEGEQKEGREGHHQGEQPSPSLEEIGHHRARAQQNSMEAIRNAEERYAKATQAGSAATNDVKESVGPGLGAAYSYVADKSAAAKDTSLEKAPQVYGYAAEKAQQGLQATKDTTVGVGKTALDYTGKIAAGAKETVVSTGGTALHYVGEKAVEAKEVSIGVGKTVADYTKETAEKAAELAAKKAVEAKDKSLDVGKTAANYAGQKAVEAKDTALNVGKTAVSYTGEKAVATKDVTLEAGKKALGLGGQKASEAKDASKSAMDQASSKLSDIKTDIHEKQTEGKGEKQDVTTAGGEEVKGNVESGLLGAVGETFVEIAKTAKDLVVGEEDVDVVVEKKQQ